MNVLLVALALSVGAGLSVQVAVNSNLAAGLGGQPLVASLFSFVVGIVFLLMLALMLSDWQIVGNAIGHQPTWYWLGGVIGAVFVFSSTMLAPKLGVSNMVFLLIIGLLIASMVIDHFGLLHMPMRTVHWWKLTGMGVMCFGLTLFFFGDRWFTN